MKYKFIIICIILGLLSSFRLLRPGFFSMADEMHIFRLEQFHKCVVDLQIPCRHVPDAGFGYGYPLFNFYAPAFYFFSEIFHLLGFSFVNSIKIVLVLIKIIGAIGIFLLSKSLLATSLFVFAPYQATNLFVRGAFPELLALNLIPWIFYFFKKKKYLLSTIFLALLLLSHTLTSITVLLILIPYLIFFIKDYKNQIISILSAFGLSSFFLLPSFFEKNLVTIETMTQGYFHYIIHFATLYQLFISRFWGYGASLWGPKDDMAISIGLMQWLVPLLTLFFLWKNKKISKKIIFYSLSALFFIFLTHNKSTFIWQLFPFMAYFQFPWRFIGISVFLLSLISAKLKINKILISILIITTIFLNINYFKEDIWYKNYDYDKKKLSGLALKDYWPKYGEKIPNEYIYNKYIIKKSNKVTGQVNIKNDNTTIYLPVVYFPNWSLTVNEKPYKYQIDKEYGQIKFKLNQGLHTISLSFHNTPIRTIANYISLLSITILPFLWRSKKK
jgi:hypothetical protein